MKIFYIFTALLLYCSLTYSAIPGVENPDLSGIVADVNISEILKGNLSDYKPSNLVKGFHNLPHWRNDQPGLVTVDPKPVFRAGSEEGVQEYYMSLIGFPILLLLLGFIALACLQLGMLGYMNWLVPRMGPVEMDPTDDSTASIALWTHKVESSRKMWVIYFFVALVLGLFGNHFMFYGDYEYKKGYMGLDLALHTLTKSLDQIEVNGNNIYNAFKTTETMVLAAGDPGSNCPQAADPKMLKLIDSAYAEIASISKNSEIIKEQVIDSHTELIKINERKEIALWVIYGVSLGVLLCFLGCFFTKQSFFMNISIIVCQITMIVLLGICTIELIFMMAVGDFCMNPTLSAVDALEPGSQIAKTARYYSICDGATGNGDNFIHKALAMAYEARRELGTALQILAFPDEDMDPKYIYPSPGGRQGGPICGPPNKPLIDQDVVDSFRQLQHLAPDFRSTVDLVECKRLQKIWRTTLEVALCQNTLKGIYLLYLAQILTTIGLFLTSLAASIMMLYFDEYWDISATMDAKIKQKLAEDEGDPYAESDTTESVPLSQGTRSDGYTPVSTA